MAGSFIEARYQTPQPLLAQYIDLEQNLGKLVVTTFRRRFVRLRPVLLAVLKIKPGAVHYPIRWKSRKQQKAFFATDGFGAGIPTTRTDSYINAFEVEIVTTEFAGQIIARNDNPAASYIGGDDQQPFHIDTGWQNINATLEDEAPKIDTLLTNDFFLLADPEALTR